jgi:hypothetical protein
MNEFVEVIDGDSRTISVYRDGNDTITLPRAVVWKLLAAFRDTHGIITVDPLGKAGCALDRSEEIAILDAALKEEVKP